MRKSADKKVSLGAIIVALFQEAKKVTRNRVEQKILVYAALKDMLRSRNHILFLKA